MLCGSIENKRNDTGLRCVLQKPEAGQQGFLIWQKDQLPALVNWNDPVVKHGLGHRVTYARLVQRKASSRTYENMRRSKATKERKVALLKRTVASTGGTLLARSHAASQTEPVLSRLWSLRQKAALPAVSSVPTLASGRYNATCLQPFWQPLFQQPTFCPRVRKSCHCLPQVRKRACGPHMSECNNAATEGQPLRRPLWLCQSRSASAS